MWDGVSHINRKRFLLPKPFSSAQGVTPAKGRKLRTPCAPGPSCAHRGSLLPGPCAYRPLSAHRGTWGFAPCRAYRLASTTFGCAKHCGRFFTYTSAVVLLAATTSASRTEGLHILMVRAGAQAWNKGNGALLLLSVCTRALICTPSSIFARSVCI